MTVTVTVGTLTLTTDQKVLADNLRVSRSINQRDTCSFKIIDEDADKDVHQGAPVEVDVDGSVEFRGFAEKTVYSLRDDGVRLVSVDAVDNHYLADKRIVARVWEDTTAGEIVKDIIDSWLSEEGVTEGDVDDGPPVVRWKANYEPASTVIEELAEQSNFHWEIDEDRVLSFTAREKVQAPWSIEPLSLSLRAQWEAGWPLAGATVREGNPDFRSVQYVVGGRDTTDELTEEFVGDGERGTFNVAFPVAAEPEVLVDGQPQTVGVRGVEDDSDAQWFYAKRSTEISQHQQDPRLGSLEKLTVNYRGHFEAVTRSHDQSVIDGRVALQGDTSGQVENVFVDQSLESRGEMFDRAAAKLDKFSREGKQLSFGTLRSGLRPGQLLHVTIPKLGLDDDLLITRTVLTQFRVGKDGAIWGWDVTAVLGPLDVSWVEFWKAIERRDSLQVLENISEDQVLTLLFDGFSKDWTFAENPNMFRRLKFDGNWQFDGTYTFNFQPDQRISHIEWTELGDPNNVLGRTQPIHRSGLESDEIHSTAYLSPVMGSDGGVGELHWYGGVEASDVVGSGVRVATEVLDEAKATTEAFQVERTDREEGGFVAPWED